MYDTLYLCNNIDGQLLYKHILQSEDVLQSKMCDTLIKPTLVTPTLVMKKINNALNPHVP